MIPEFIINKYESKEFSGSILAGAMFVDISGFTSMTQKLMTNGKEGVEVLTDAMNFIFSPSITTIMQHNGFVSSFAGDAFTAIFPMEKSSLKNFISAAIKIKNIFQKRNRFSSDFAEFNIKVKISLSFGDVRWNIIKGRKYYSYFFDGEAIAGCARVEKFSNSDKIIITNKLKKKIADLIDTTLIKDDIYAIENVNFDLIEVKNKIRMPKRNLEKFIPKEILTLQEIGEFRKVISCFVSVQKDENFLETITKIMDLATYYKGYFNKIDFGDKGYVILIIFGAPVIPDNIFQRAAEFAIKVKKIKKAKKRIGMSFGVTYSGFIGSEHRKEYTSIGMAVNMAARLMMQAKTNEIAVERNLKNNLIEKYEFIFDRYYKLKGFERKIAVYILISSLKKKENKKKKFIFINREEEKDFIRKVFYRTEKRKIAEVLHIIGREGVGKTTLINHIKNRMKKSKWRILTCDAIEQKSFYPIKNDLKDFFSIEDDKTISENLIEFNLKFDELKENNISYYNKTEWGELKYYLSFFLDLENDRKFNLPQDLIKKNIIRSLSMFYKIILEAQISALVLDDADYADEDTLEFIKYFSGFVEFDSFVIIFVSHSDKVVTDLFLPQSDLIIEPFNKKNSHNQILAILKKRGLNLKYIPKKTFELIFEKTEGVPLFVEQTVHFLMDNKLLAEDGKLIHENFEIPSDISLLIISKIDKFEPEFKKITKVASVLGRKFSDTLLSSVVKEENLEKFIINGEKEDIWLSLTKLDHIFKSSLIRDSVYELILKKELLNLHKKVADTIKKIYKANMELYYSDIAYNYLLAKDLNNAIKYFEKAYIHSFKKYLLTDAVRYLKELYKIEKNKKYLLKIIEILIMKGKTNEVANYLQTAEKVELLSKEKEELYLLKTKYLILIQEYNELERYVNGILPKIKTKKIKKNLYIYLLDTYRALNKDEKFYNLIKSIQKEYKKSEIEYAKLANNVGIFYLQKAKYKKAEGWFEKAFNSAEKLNDKILSMKALHNIGIIKSRLGDRKQARDYYTKALEISIKIGDENTTVKLLSDIASIYSINNQVDKALNLYNKALKLNQALGNRFQQGILLYNMAEGYFRLQDYENAIKFVNQSIEICKSINDLTGITFGYDLLGDILFSQEKYKKAKTIYNKNLKIQKEINDPEGIAHTYGNLGNLSKVDKDYHRAEFYYKKQIKILKKVGDIEGEGKAWFNWAMVETERKNFDSAKDKLKKAIELFDKCSFKYGYDLAMDQMKKLKKGGE